MFVARGIGILLAVFMLLYVPLSLAICLAWKALWRGIRPRSAWGSANLLFALRLAPFVLSVMFTLLFTLPSFLLLEPRSPDESVGTVPLLLGCAAGHCLREELSGQCGRSSELRGRL